MHIFVIHWKNQESTTPPLSHLLSGRFFPERLQLVKDIFAGKSLPTSSGMSWLSRRLTSCALVQQGRLHVAIFSRIHVVQDFASVRVRKVVKHLVTNDTGITPSSQLFKTNHLVQDQSLSIVNT
jgi:hypothetical protein